jgi:hypothetical protein
LSIVAAEIQRHLESTLDSARSSYTTIHLLRWQAGEGDCTFPIVNILSPAEKINKMPQVGDMRSFKKMLHPLLPNLTSCCIEQHKKP